jgi:hypothetical protein
VAAFREGVTYDEAFEAGLGVTVEEIDEQWRASLPYEVIATDSFVVTTSMWDVLIWIAAALALVLFTAGALLTATILLRRRRPTDPQPPAPGL